MRDEVQLTDMFGKDFYVKFHAQVWLGENMSVKYNSQKKSVSLWNGWNLVGGRDPGARGVYPLNVVNADFGCFRSWVQGIEEDDLRVRFEMLRSLVMFTSLFDGPEMADFREYAVTSLVHMLREMLGF